ncbi:hypothetical protein HGRIS_005113 [Hohenbuehelia grisea]|uniref:histidine kinase n=1 Tax=Hohenbuehelia grisea TaxID=104357 RepID=A0ABR3JE87_9AGAR
MPFWSPSTTASSSTRWTEDPLPSFRKYDMENSEKHFLTTTASTPVTVKDEEGLPPPATQSEKPSAFAKTKKTARVGVKERLTVHWARLKRRIGTGTAPSTSSLNNNESNPDSNRSIRAQTADPDSEDQVDEVVVDRTWSDEIKSSVTHSEHGGTPEKSGGSYPQTGASEHESFVERDGFWASCTPLIVLRYRLWPAMMEFFNPRFMDEKSERHYAMESWFLRKSLALWSAAWLVLNWILGCAFVPAPLALADKVFYYAVLPVLSLPVGIMVMYDWPRDRPIFYQLFLTLSIWCWAFYFVAFMYLCGYYKFPDLRTTTGWHFSCGTKDFIGIFYYTSALQTIGLFGLKLNRFPAAVGATSFFIFSCAALIPDRLPWARSMINFAIFHIFLIYVHYMRESSERRLFTLRDQLKIQFKATQKAQVNERKAADSKRRLTSSECPSIQLVSNLGWFTCRFVSFTPFVPVLAVQNMAASGTVAKEQEIEFKALEGSLSMMSKVLNDVLDFNRMDSGRFESANKPYVFHQVMRQLFVPLQLATDARGLEFVTDLDPNIDLIARRSAYEAMGFSQSDIIKHVKEHPDAEGVVVGDESRLLQIITNLASNACKFTPSGGKLAISTRLILPAAPEGEILDLLEVPPSAPSSVDEHHMLSATHLTQHNRHHGKPSPLEWIVVRIEVTDSGCGIRSRDMAQSKLFSAFNQTEMGRQQGGKGTGLGLALVRQIVKLTGGRLGVISKANEGSTFWVELPLGVGKKALDTQQVQPETDSSASNTSHIGNIRRNHMSLPLDVERDAAAREEAPRAASQSDLPSGSKRGLGASGTRSTSALQGLMEQGVFSRVSFQNQMKLLTRCCSGGRVELKLAKDTPSTVLTRTIGNASPGTDYGTPETPTSPTDTTPRPEMDSQQSGDTVMQQVNSRPTFVALPSPRSFAPDVHPTSSTNTSGHSMSSSSSSPLTAFDNSFNRGSPSSSSPTITFEPGLNVLVVDDDPLTRTLMKRILTRLGCTVATAENGEVALDMILGNTNGHGLTPSSDGSNGTGPILEQHERPPPNPDESRYAVVFLDNQMPVMSGLHAVGRLREMGRKDFVVGVTGNALLSDQQEYLEAGVDRILTKPVLERSLRDILLIAEERRKRSSVAGSTKATRA